MAYEKGFDGLLDHCKRENRSQKQIILDMDGSVSPTYGHQEGSSRLAKAKHRRFCANRTDHSGKRGNS